MLKGGPLAGRGSEGTESRPDHNQETPISAFFLNLNICGISAPNWVDQPLTIDHCGGLSRMHGTGGQPPRGGRGGWLVHSLTHSLAMPSRTSRPRRQKTSNDTPAPGLRILKRRETTEARVREEGARWTYLIHPVRMTSNDSRGQPHRLTTPVQKTFSNIVGRP